MEVGEEEFIRSENNKGDDANLTASQEGVFKREQVLLTRPGGGGRLKEQTGAPANPLTAPANTLPKNEVSLRAALSRR